MNEQGVWNLVSTLESLNKGTRPDLTYNKFFQGFMEGLEVVRERRLDLSEQDLHDIEVAKFRPVDDKSATENVQKLSVRITCKPRPKPDNRFVLDKELLGDGAPAQVVAQWVKEREQALDSDAATDRFMTVNEYYGHKGDIKSIMEWHHAVGPDGKTPGDLQPAGHTLMTFNRDQWPVKIEMYDAEKKRLFFKQFSQKFEGTFQYLQIDGDNNQQRTGTTTFSRRGDTLTERSVDGKGRLVEEHTLTPKSCRSVITPTEAIRVAFEFVKDESGNPVKLITENPGGKVTLGIEALERDARGNVTKAALTPIEGDGEATILVREFQYYE